MILIKKRNLIVISILILAILTSSVCFYGIKKANKNNVESSQYKIVLDAGHGGVDGGVSGVNTGVKESELNLIITKKLEKQLLDAGFNVVLTRKTDAGLYGLATDNLKRKDMQKRQEIINKERPNLVLSIHLNKFSVSTRRGAQVFYKNGDENAKLLANSIQNAFNLMEEAPRQSSALVGDYYILNCSNYPSVIAECGFLSNPDDESLLITDEYQEKIAYSIYRGIVEYLTNTDSLQKQN